MRWRPRCAAGGFARDRLDGPDQVRPAERRRWTRRGARLQPAGRLVLDPRAGCFAGADRGCATLRARGALATAWRDGRVLSVSYPASLAALPATRAACVQLHSPPSASHRSHSSRRRPPPGSWSTPRGHRSISTPRVRRCARYGYRSRLRRPVCWREPSSENASCSGCRAIVSAASSRSRSGSSVSGCWSLRPPD